MNPFSLLGYPDSNQERQDQNLQCYHYTIAQSICSPKDCLACKRCSLFASAKVRRFYDSTKLFSEKITKKIRIRLVLLSAPPKSRIFGV